LEIKQHTFTHIQIPPSQEKHGVKSLSLANRITSPTSDDDELNEWIIGQMQQAVSKTHFLIIGIMGLYIKKITTFQKYYLKKEGFFK